MRERRAQIDLVKLALYILKRCWLMVICAAIGFDLETIREAFAPYCTQVKEIKTAESFE